MSFWPTPSGAGDAEIDGAELEFAVALLGWFSNRTRTISARFSALPPTTTRLFSASQSFADEALPAGNVTRSCCSASAICSENPLLVAAERTLRAAWLRYGYQASATLLQALERSATADHRHLARARRS